MSDEYVAELSALNKALFDANDALESGNKDLLAYNAMLYEEVKRLNGENKKLKEENQELRDELISYGKEACEFIHYHLRISDRWNFSRTQQFNLSIPKRPPQLVIEGLVEASLLLQARREGWDIENFGDTTTTIWSETDES